jgi:Ni/Co efflux regulator RcnB
MTRRFLQAGVCVLTAIVTGFSGFALAQQQKDQLGEDHRPADRSGTREVGDRHERDRGNDREAVQRQREVARGQREDAFRNREMERNRDQFRRGGWREAGPDHRFRRGGYLPPEYRGRAYVVNDWRARRLSAPPRGYHWVRDGSDFVLVAIATGLIAQVLLNQ